MVCFIRMCVSKFNLISICINQRWLYSSDLGHEVVHPIVTPNSQPFADDRDASFSTPSNLPMCTGAHGDVTSLTHAEVVRKRARNWYASLTQEQKDERNKKDRERRKRKKEKSQVLNKSATNSGVGKYPKGSNILFLPSALAWVVICICTNKKYLRSLFRRVNSPTWQAFQYKCCWFNDMPIGSERFFYVA